MFFFLRTLSFADGTPPPLAPSWSEAAEALPGSVTNVSFFRRFPYLHLTAFLLKLSFPLLFADSTLE